MKLALSSRSLPDPVPAGPLATLDAIAALGLDGCFFTSPFELSPRLHPDELSAVRAHAESLGLSFEVGLGQIHPLHFGERADLLALGDGDMRAALERVVRALSAVGRADMMFFIGTLADRFSQAVAWKQQLESTGQFLVSLAPVLREHGCRLTLKTHEEITTFEILRLIEVVGADVLGVCLDPVNVLTRLEDPLEATRRLAPYVRQVVLDDAIVRLTDVGLERWLCPCGTGVLDWPAILGTLPRSPDNLAMTVELHRAFLDMPIFDPSWLAAQPDLTTLEFAAMVKLGQASVARAFDPAYQHTPWTRLEPTLTYLRGLPAA